MKLWADTAKSVESRLLGCDLVRFERTFHSSLKFISRLSSSLLQTKLYIPPTRPELVARPRLIERLNEGPRSGRKLTLISALVVIAGLGYTFDSVTGFLFPNFGLTVSQFTFIGEMLLALWLVVKAVSVKQWEKLALESAPI